MDKKPVIAILSLTCCEGCQVSIFDCYHSPTHRPLFASQTTIIKEIKLCPESPS